MQFLTKCTYCLKLFLLSSASGRLSMLLELLWLFILKCWDYWGFVIKTLGESICSGWLRNRKWKRRRTDSKAPFEPERCTPITWMVWHGYIFHERCEQILISSCWIHPSASISRNLLSFFFGGQSYSKYPARDTSLLIRIRWFPQVRRRWSS